MCRSSSPPPRALSRRWVRVLRTNVNGQVFDRLTLLNQETAIVTAHSGAIASEPVTVNRDAASEPLVTSVRPGSGAPGATLSVTINGSNFQPGAVVSFDQGIAVNSVRFISPTQLIANITIDPNIQNTSTARTVTVTNPDGGSGNLPNAFQITTTNPAPVITSINPTVTTSRGAPGITVTINGFDFQTGAQVTFSSGAGSVNIIGTTVNGASQIDVDIVIDPLPTGPPVGTVFQVRVRNPDGLVSNLANFTTN